MKKNILLLCLIILVNVSCNNTKQEEFSDEPTVRDTVEESVEVEELLSSTGVVNEVLFNGVIVTLPENHASVTLTMDGIVKSTKLLAGTYVKKGQVLAILENPDFIDLQQVYLESYSQTEYLEAEFKRQEVLAREDAAPQKRAEQGKAEYLSMKSRKDAAAAQLRLLGISPEELLEKGIREYLEVKAPISGYISQVQVNLGKYITAGESMCEIINNENVLIKLSAYEKDIEKMSVGDKLSFIINGLNNKEYTGEIISIAQSVDPLNRSSEVYAKINESESRFRSGMYINAKVMGK